MTLEDWVADHSWTIACFRGRALGLPQTFVVGGRQLTVRAPSPQELAAGELESERAHQEALAAGAPSRAAVPARMRAAGTWGDASDRELTRLTQQGDYAARVALLRQWREEDGRSAEGLAANAAFAAWVASCTSDAATGQPVFADADDYSRHAGEPYAYEAASRLFTILTS